MKIIMIAVALAACAAAQPGRRMEKAAGMFDVKMTPQGEPDKESPALARMSIEKTYHGDLEGLAKGEMLAVGSANKSGAYVAIERVTATLKGRKGSFAMHHTGVMTRGEPSLSVLIAPDSGTGELEGISGKLTIRIEGGKHFYELEYELK